MAKKTKKKPAINARKKNGNHKTSKGRAKTLQEVEGVLSMARDGFGFVTAIGFDEDIFIPFSKMNRALNGDTVRVAITKQRRDGKRYEGSVSAVVERSRKPHIGILSVRGNHAWAIVESGRMPYDIKIVDKDIAMLPVINGKPAANGMKVAVLVKSWPQGSTEPLGEIVDVLGNPGENNTEMHAILAEYGLPYRFSPEVEDAANHISDGISVKEIKNRRDFRDIVTFTIDPADAKDFDDAISFRKMDNGHFEVGVHIADVTFYVKQGDLVDREAYARATSVYLVDRTIPMLPENLCNKLCSLRPNEEKLCFSAVFELDENSSVFNRWFGRTIIKSCRRFDYEEAQEIIMSGQGNLAEELGTLNRLASILRKKRFEKGAINFERPEMKVEIDNSGKPVNVFQKESKESNWLIEEFMLLANRSVAEYVTRMLPIKKPTFVFRIHEAPMQEKLGGLRQFAKNFGHTLGPTENSKQISKSLSDLLVKAKDRPEENALQLLALRAMARACYSTDNIGHYGLAFQYYTHFTSPIRRYPDMMVHRLLAMYMDGAPSQKKEEYENWCQHSSEREQLATEAERASIKYKLVEFMQDKIGQEFDGTISGLTEWGMYVEIEPSKIEGMVSIKEMQGDYFSFDEEKYRITGKSSGKIYTLGDKVRIKVARANLEQKMLDYELLC